MEAAQRDAVEELEARLAAATAAKAALEAQLADAQVILEATEADRNGAFDERDALAAQLKEMRELLQEAREHLAWGAPGRSVLDLSRRIDAALAASGPGETQG